MTLPLDQASRMDSPQEQTSGMKTLTFPGTDLVASNIILGLMRIQSLDDEEVRTLVQTARDEGINFFDHADVYGGETHGCEQRWGDVAPVPAYEREQIILQSKVGIRND